MTAASARPRATSSAPLRYLGSFRVPSYTKECPFLPHRRFRVGTRSIVGVGPALKERILPGIAFGPGGQVVAYASTEPLKLTMAHEYLEGEVQGIHMVSPQFLIEVFLQADKACTTIGKGRVDMACFLELPSKNPVPFWASGAFCCEEETGFCLDTNDPEHVYEPETVFLFAMR